MGQNTGVTLGPFPFDETIVIHLLMKMLCGNLHNLHFFNFAKKSGPNADEGNLLLEEEPSFASSPSGLVQFEIS